MKIRLHGTEDECRTMTGLLEQIMTVQSVSEPYPDRGRSVLVRVYVDGIPRPGADDESWRSTLADYQVASGSAEYDDGPDCGCDLGTARCRALENGEVPE